MNSFELKLINTGASWTLPEWALALKVDGQMVSEWEHDMVYIFGLTDAVLSSGEFEVVTCTCGDASCAGLGKVKVELNENKTRWSNVGSCRAEFEFDPRAVFLETHAALSEARDYLAGQDIEKHPIIPPGGESDSLSKLVAKIEANYKEVPIATVGSGKQNSLPSHRWDPTRVEFRSPVEDRSGNDFSDL